MPELEMKSTHTFANHDRALTVGDQKAGATSFIAHDRVTGDLIRFAFLEDEMSELLCHLQCWAISRGITIHPEGKYWMKKDTSEEDC